MAVKSCLTQVLLLIILKFVHTSVNPPEDLTITDPGNLGNLEVRWSPPLGLVRVKEKGQCLVLYEPHYYDSYSSSWTSIRTTQTSFTAQFDLAQEVKVRVYSVISGACVEGRTVKSKNYTEVVQKPHMAGMEGIQDLTCVYYNMEQLVCSWRRSSKMPAKAQVALYYWHRELAQAKECPRYVISGGFRNGCNFSETVLPTFSDVNLCVNASSDRPIRARYTTLQIQNTGNTQWSTMCCLHQGSVVTHCVSVKPKAPGQVRVEAGADRQLRAHWDSPDGKIPQHCLQWQVQDRREDQEDKHTLITSRETAVMLALSDNETSCLRVRSMLNKYCADSGVWSDWSPSVCFPEKQSVASASSRDMFPEYKYTIVTLISGLVLLLCVCAAVRLLKRSRQVTKKKASPSSPFDKNSSEIVSVVQNV